MLGLAGLIAWIEKHWAISDMYVGLSTILLLLSIYPGVLLARNP